jgi:death on curing protein
MTDVKERMHFIDKRTIVAINRMCTDLTGGTSLSSTNIREGQNLSFVDRIFFNEFFGMTLYPDIFHRAAAYLFYIVKNHIFIDGNKRTGLAVALTFLEWNGFRIEPLHEDSVFDTVISIAAGPNNPDEQIPQISEWLASLCVRMSKKTI